MEKDMGHRHYVSRVQYCTCLLPTRTNFSVSLLLGMGYVSKTSYCTDTVQYEFRWPYLYASTVSSCTVQSSFTVVFVLSCPPVLHITVRTTRKKRRRRTVQSLNAVCTVVEYGGSGADQALISIKTSAQKGLCYMIRVSGVNLSQLTRVQENSSLLRNYWSNMLAVNKEHYQSGTGQPSAPPQKKLLVIKKNAYSDAHYGTLKLAFPTANHFVSLCWIATLQYSTCTIWAYSTRVMMASSKNYINYKL